MKMNKIKKVLAVALSFTMVFGMAITSNAATHDTTVQEEGTMVLSSDGSEVSFKAVTTDGGERDGVVWPSVTRYSYYIELPSSGSKAEVPVAAEYDKNYTLKIDGAAAQVETAGEYEGTLDFSKGTKTFELVASDGKVYRSYQVATGVKGSELPTVYVRVDVKNALDWLGTKGNSNDTTKTAVEKVTKAIEAHGYTVNDDGQMADFVEVNGLKPGATAMDALESACETLGLQTAGSSYYVSGIGVKDTDVFLSERATTGYSGWLYLDKPVNGKAFEMANYGASSYNLNGGEQFVWAFANGWDDDQYMYLNK